jgi:uncharacterized protein with von Willebrand factor type A (vWA) domain
MTPASGDLRLAEQIVRFARVLRASGVKVGPGAALDAVEAVESSRRDPAAGLLLDTARNAR